MSERPVDPREALETLCRDSLESSVAEVIRREDDGEITVAMQAVIRAVDALEAAERERDEWKERCVLDGAEADARAEARVVLLEAQRDAAVGLGYTLATRRLFADVSKFHAYAEELLGRPIFTHEFGDEQTWADLRAAFEDAALAAVSVADSGPAPEPCPHPSASFDRTLCACGSMHDYCETCGKALDCPLDSGPEEKKP